MGDDVLSDRAVNRATLERQMLLRRHDVPVEEAVRRTVALNAQAPDIPYLWAWGRLSGFRHEELTRAIEERRLVRSVLLRATQHLVAAEDLGWLWAVVAPLLARVQRNVFGRRAAGVDPDELAAATVELLAGTTLTRPELSRRLAERWPDAERTALGWSAQYLVPILHPAPSGTWGVLGATPFVLAADWLDGTPSAPGGPEELVRRHLAAFGPATVADIRAWSGVAGLKEVVAGMAGELRRFRSESGRPLLDLPDAPRPPEDVEAPARLLAEFDDLLLAHHDRGRVMTDDVRRRVCVGDAVAATVLVDGRVAATWAHARTDTTSTVTVTPFHALAPATRSAVESEAASLLPFLTPDAPGLTPAVEVLPPAP